MLRILNTQLNDLGASREAEFIDELLAHATEFFPEHLQFMTAGDLRRTAALTISVGRRHRLTTLRAIYLYFNCVLLLGSGLLSDPWHPWAGELLRAHRDPEDGIEAVSDKANEFFDEACGPRHIHLFSTGRRLATDAGLLARLRAMHIDAFPEFFGAFFPAKYAAMDAEHFRQGLRAARRQAGVYGLVEDSDVVPYVFTSLLLGGGLDRDPQFPFAAAALNNKALPAEQKTARLFEGLVAVGRGFSQTSLLQNDATHV